MNNYFRFLIPAFIIGSVLFSSCSNNKPAPTNNAVVNNRPLNVVADPGLESVMKQQQYIYEALSNDTVKVLLTYKSEADMLKEFSSRQADMLVLSRKLTDAEKQGMIDKDTIYAREIPIAYDAVAIIGNLQYDDAKLDTVQLRQYFNPTNTAGNSQMVFDKQNTSVVSYMLNYFGYNGKASPNLYAVQSPQEVINYVIANKNAIGFIPYTLIADADDDAIAQDILRKVKVLSLQVKDKNGLERHVNANQSEIAEGIYPLRRTVYAVVKYNFNEPAWQFVSFLTKEKASRIFLKAGMVPLQIPFREIDVNTDGFKGIN